MNASMFFEVKRTKGGNVRTEHTQSNFMEKLELSRMSVPFIPNRGVFIDAQFDCFPPMKTLVMTGCGFDGNRYVHIAQHCGSFRRTITVPTSDFMRERKKYLSAFRDIRELDIILDRMVGAYVMLA